MGLIAEAASVAVAVLVVAGTAAAVVAVSRLAPAAGSQPRPCDTPGVTFAGTDIPLTPAAARTGEDHVSKFCGAHRPPRAGIDPVDHAGGALAVIRSGDAPPAAPETVVLVLDGDRRGRTVVVVDGTDDADAVARGRRAAGRARSPIGGRRGASSSPRSGPAVARSTATPTAGSRPASCRATPASSCSSGSSSPTTGGRPTAWCPATSSPSRRGGVAGHDGRRRGSARRVRAAAAAPGVSRSPAARSRRTSSRLSTSTAPAATTAGRCSSGMS